MLKRNPLVRMAAFKAAEIGHGLHRVLGRSAPSFDGEVSRIDTFDERFDELWSRNGGFDFVSDRSCAYLNWRYADKRGGEYTVFAATSGDDVLGYVALLQNEGRGQILDLFTLPNRDDAAHALIQRSLAHLSEAGEYVVECRMAAGNRYEPLLVRSGFVDTHRPSNFHYLNQNLSPSEVEAMEGKDAVLQLMGGDL
jgi:hypothetical protein